MENEQASRNRTMNILPSLAVNPRVLSLYFSLTIASGSLRTMPFNTPIHV